MLPENININTLNDNQNKIKTGIRFKHKSKSVRKQLIQGTEGNLKIYTAEFCFWSQWSSWYSTALPHHIVIKLDKI